MVYTKKGRKGFSKGNPGKPKGAVSAKTKAWKELGEFICNAGAGRYMEALMGLEDKDYLDKYAHVLEFFKPKLARTEMKHEGEIITGFSITRLEKKD